ncbi:MAG: ATP-grasp domain-containing protein [Saprospiraceae bacterium]
MEKRILVFGAGDNQHLLIKACKELGYFTVATDPNANAPGRAEADVFAVLPPKDFEGHCDLIERERIGGIVTCQMENPLLMMAELAQKYGFLFPEPAVIHRARNKYLMKQAFLQHGVPCAKGIKIDGLQQLEALDLSEWQFPLIIKPVDSFSSRGVYRAETRAALLDHYTETARFSSSDQVLVEEFLEGPEVSVEGVVFNGEAAIIQVTDKVITPYPHTVELAHFQPTSLSAAVCDAIGGVVKSAIAALGMDHTGFHAELKLTQQGPKMIEIGARLGGDYISSYLTQLSTGVDLNRAIAQIAMGDQPDLKIAYHRFSGIQYVNWDAGKKVKAVQSIELFLKKPQVAYADIFVKPGDILPQITESSLRHSFFITSGTDRNELLVNIERLSKELSDLLILE